MSLKQYVEYTNAKAVFGETLFDLRTINDDVAQEMFMRMNADEFEDASDEKSKMISNAWYELNGLVQSLTNKG